MKSEEQSVDMNWQNVDAQDLKQSPTPTFGTKRSRITRACKLDDLYIK